MSITNLYNGPQTDRDGNACIWLQEVGLHRAKPAAELHPGDVMVWNFGSTSTILTVRHHKNSVYVTQRDDHGTEWPERRFVKSRLVAVSLSK